MDKAKLYQAAINRWGVEAQVNQTIEECAELILVLRHWGRNKTIVQEVASEIADVEIMCEQLRILIGDTLVDEEKKYKLWRLKGTIENG